MASSGEPAPSTGGLAQRLARPAQILIVTSVMFTFISYWRTAAVVLCDLASTAYYIGGIVEQSIGPAAPWFILAVMCFSYAVRSVYIESCTLFVRGGVYRVVREALGSFTAKIAVSALMFDYILTGPISGVSAGKYIVGLLLELLRYFSGVELDAGPKEFIMNWGAAGIACAIVGYFFWLNLKGIHESSGKALTIMVITTIMAVIVLLWCGLTLALGPANWGNLQRAPDLSAKVQYQETDALDPVTGKPQKVWKLGPDGQPVPDVFANGKPVPKVNKVTGEQEDPLGFLAWILPKEVADALRQPGSWFHWFGLVGVLGIFLAFGHSILAMSGEETLAQVYREVESPKLPNFKKAAFIVFVYSLLFTGGISFLAVLLIPNSVRMKNYDENLIGGLAMNLYGPILLRLALNVFVVCVGFLILAGAVNTSIIGSNGVLNRVAEDGVLADWFLKPNRKYGTTSRILWLIFTLQIATILISQGNVLLLGEAYAFGVIWSFVFQALSMVILRFRDPRPREYKVPFNIKLGGIEVPIGLGIILLILLLTAVMNLLTKEVATVGGLVFTAVFFTIFSLSEVYHAKRRGGKRHEHLEQFNEQTTPVVSPESLGLNRPYRKLVAIRSPQNLFMLEKALAETDPETTDVVVMTAKALPTGETPPVDQLGLDTYDQQLMTAVVQKAEQAGKQVRPLIVPTNNPLHAVLKTAQDLHAQELVMGGSNKYTADEQLEQIAFYWISLHGGEPTPLTVRILSRERDMYLDLAGGNRIPKISERKARTVAELRAAGVGVDRVLLTHDGSQTSSDLFQSVLTMLDPDVALGLVPLVPAAEANGASLVRQDQERAANLGRQLQLLEAKHDTGAEIVRLAREGQFDLIILCLSHDSHGGPPALLDLRTEHVLRHAHCPVFLAAAPGIPQEVVDTNPSTQP
jgi:amino acid transporter/nucleotide-binding universal stress UspA family protein